MPILKLTNAEMHEQPSLLGAQLFLGLTRRRRSSRSLVGSRVVHASVWIGHTVCRRDGGTRGQNTDQIVGWGDIVIRMTADDLARFTLSLKSKPSRDSKPYRDVVRASAQFAAQHLTNTGRIARFKKSAMWACRELESHGLRSIAVWHKGYFHYLVQDFDSARALFREAETGCETELGYWLDRGRLEYNTGFLMSALRAFETAESLADQQGTRDAQIYRWLSKTHRWLGRFEREAAYLERGVLEYSSDQKSLDLAFNHLGRAFLMCGKYREALEFVSEWFAWPHGCQVEFACIKAEALCRLGRVAEALDYAERVAGKFDSGEFVRHSTGAILERRVHGGNSDGSAPIGVGYGALVIAAALRHASLPFTADNALIQSLVTSAAESNLHLTLEIDQSGETWSTRPTDQTSRGSSSAGPTLSPGKRRRSRWRSTS